MFLITESPLQRVIGWYWPDNQNLKELSYCKVASGMSFALEIALEVQIM